VLRRVTAPVVSERPVLFRYVLCCDESFRVDTNRFNLLRTVSRCSLRVIPRSFSSGPQYQFRNRPEWLVSFPHRSEIVFRDATSNRSANSPFSCVWNGIISISCVCRACLAPSLRCSSFTACGCSRRRSITHSVQRRVSQFVGVESVE
jgi:hypothetical protein